MLLAWSLLIYSTSFAKEVDIDRDVMRLAVKEQQDALFEKQGQYSQHRKGGDFDTPLGEEQFVISGLLDNNYWVDIYESSCGKGFILNP